MATINISQITVIVERKSLGISLCALCVARLLASSWCMLVEQIVIIGFRTPLT